MNIPLEQIGISGGTILSGVVAITTLWFKIQNKVENLERKDIEQEHKIDGINKWTHDHEKEAATSRENFSKELFELKGAQMVVGEQFKQIMSVLQDIKERMEKLEDNKGG